MPAVDGDSRSTAAKDQHMAEVTIEKLRAHGVTQGAVTVPGGKYFIVAGTAARQAHLLALIQKNEVEFLELELPWC